MGISVDGGPAAIEAQGSAIADCHFALLAALGVIKEDSSVDSGGRDYLPERDLCRIKGDDFPALLSDLIGTDKVAK